MWPAGDAMLSAPLTTAAKNGLAMSGTTSAIAPVLPDFNDWAAGLGRKPMVAMV